MEAKRQNKLLKLAIGRLQNELEKKEVDVQSILMNVAKNKNLN